MVGQLEYLAVVRKVAGSNPIRVESEKRSLFTKYLTIVRVGLRRGKEFAGQCLSYAFAQDTESF